MMPMPPCKNCERRHPGCHSKCSAYQAWSEKRQAIAEQIRKENALDAKLMHLDHIHKALRDKNK